MKALIILVACTMLGASCNKKHAKLEETNLLPVVTKNGSVISFADTQSIAFFKTEAVKSSNMNAEFTVLGKIAATVMASGQGASQNIILFDNPSLAGNYTFLIKHQINIHQIHEISIKQKQIDLDRIKDLQQHGAATGKDLLDAQTALAMEYANLNDEKAALIEHEATLIAGGFDPEVLRKAKAGTAYLICDIPENQISKIEKGSSCNIEFTAFPNEKFAGKIDDVADMVDNTTRMVKIRISINNSSSKLKAGMFATVSFGLSEGNFVNVSKNALVTVQGKTYVFRKNNNREFERCEVNIGQQIGDRVIVFGGITDGDQIANKGVMQLKGLAFGY